MAQIQAPRGGGRHRADGALQGDPLDDADAAVVLEGAAQHDATMDVDPVDEPAHRIPERTLRQNERFLRCDADLGRARHAVSSWAPVVSRIIRRISSAAATRSASGVR